MIQSLHILRKDVRHLWPDLSVYVAVLIAFGFVIPMDWSGADAENMPLRLLIGLLRILIPILWLVMIARLIHDESLVGDQQFWITRPYTWASLLGAKLLFIALCLVLPFVVMQWVLLLQAGLNPIQSISGQLLALLFLALIAWLPFTAIASVTSTLQRMFMSLLAAIIVWGAVLALVSSTVGPRTPLPFALQASLIVLGTLLLGTLIYQYARRDTLRSRIALVATAVILLVSFWGLVAAELTGPANSLIRHHYPVSTDPSLQLTFDSSFRPTQDKEDRRLRIGKLRLVRLPVSIQGLDSLAQLDDQTVSFSIDSPGYHYVSPWRPTGFDDKKLALFVPQDVFDKIHGSKVSVHLSMGAQRFRPGTPEIVTAADDFRVPEGGRCHLLPTGSETSMSCRYAFQIASRMTVQATVSAAPCGNSGPTRPTFATIGARIPDPAADPTVERNLSLGGAVCPGTQLTFTPYHPAEYFRLELEIPSISLEQYILR